MKDYLADDLRRILGFHDTRTPNLTLAFRHAEEWQTHHMPWTRDERGGSSSPREISERLEDQAVARQAARDHAELRRLVPEFRSELALCGILGEVTPELRRISERLARIVARCTRTVDASTLPPEGPDGCVSCDRLNRLKGWRHGHVWQPLSEMDRYAKNGLCSWCGKHSTREGWVDIKYVQVRHRDGEHKAGREMARDEAEAKKRAKEQV